MLSGMGILDDVSGDRLTWCISSTCLHFYYTVLNLDHKSAIFVQDIQYIQKYQASKTYPLPI